MPDYDDAGWEEWYEDWKADPEAPATVHEVTVEHIAESVSEATEGIREVLSSPARALEEWGEPTPEREAAAWGKPDITTLEGATHEDPSGFGAWGVDWSGFYTGIGTTELKLKPIGDIIKDHFPDLPEFPTFPDFSGIGGWKIFPEGWTLFPEIKSEDWLFWLLVGLFGVAIAIVLYKYITKKEVRVVTAIER